MYRALEKPRSPAKSVHLPATTGPPPWRSYCASCSCAGLRVSGASLCPRSLALAARGLPGTMGRGGRGRLNLGALLRWWRVGTHAPVGWSGPATRATRESASARGAAQGAWGVWAAAEPGPDRTAAVAVAPGAACGARLQGSLPWGTHFALSALVLFPASAPVLGAPAFPDFQAPGCSSFFRYRVVQAGRLNYKRHY